MKAVKWSSYEKYGCVNCGCEYCYADQKSGPTTSLTCGECNTKFMVLNDDLKVSSIGIPKENYDGLIVYIKDGELFLNNLPFKQIFSNGELLEQSKNGLGILNGNYVYLLPREHPRKDKAKHKYVSPDIRPENGIGEFCNPRGVGYDLQCFVKSKESGQRITNMINKLNEEEFNKKGFSCSLDYRENEPDWIQVKINYPNELKAIFLIGLIADNDNIITEDIVRNAMSMKVDFKNYWKYKGCGRVYNAFDMGFINDIVGKPQDFSAEKRNEIYHESFQRNNYLDQFEVWGAYKQMSSELNKGNIEIAVSLARHLINLNDSHFNHELRLQLSEKYDYITSLRGYLQDELIKSVNIYYKDNNQRTLEKNYSTIDWINNEDINNNKNMSDDMKKAFVSEWSTIVPKIFEIVDLEAIKALTNWRPRVKPDVEKEILGKYPNIYQMFSLFGLYVQVSRNIEEGNVEDALLAVQHIASQINSPLFSQIQARTSNNDSTYLMTQSVYAHIANLSSKYYGKSISEDEQQQQKSSIK